MKVDLSKHVARIVLENFWKRVFGLCNRLSSDNASLKTRFDMAGLYPSVSQTAVVALSLKVLLWPA